MTTDEIQEPDWQVGDGVVVVDTPDDGMLGTILAVRETTGEYLVVFEDGRLAVLKRANLARRY